MSNTPFISKTNPFSVPENYFENLHDSILTKTSQHKKQIFYLSPTSLAIAASLFLLISTTIVYSFFYQKDIQSNDQSLSIEFVVDQSPLYMSSINETSLEEMILDEDNESTIEYFDGISASKINLINIKDINAEDLLNYLVEDDLVDLSLTL